MASLDRDRSTHWIMMWFASEGNTSLATGQTGATEILRGACARLDIEGRQSPKSPKSIRPMGVCDRRLGNLPLQLWLGHSCLLSFICFLSLPICPTFSPVNGTCAFDSRHRFPLRWRKILQGNSHRIEPRNGADVALQEHLRINSILP